MQKELRGSMALSGQNFINKSITKPRTESVVG